MCSRNCWRSVYTAAASAITENVSSSCLQTALPRHVLVRQAGGASWWVYVQGPRPRSHEPPGGDNTAEQCRLSYHDTILTWISHSPRNLQHSAQWRREHLCECENKSSQKWISVRTNWICNVSAMSSPTRLVLSKPELYESYARRISWIIVYWCPSLNDGNRSL